jgi:predicted component of viral defense system (DUF524 family)
MTEEVAHETRNRILLSIAAYAYEFRSDSIISDAEYDQLSKLIQPQLKTGNAMLDIFFSEEFNANTGQWVTKHPELEKLKYIYETVYKGGNALG